MPATPAQLAALQRLLDGSAWLGAELDLTYRVLALTVERSPSSAVAKQGEDRRVQVLLSPASTIRACLRVIAQPPRIESFEVGQLADVVAAMQAPVLSGQMVGCAAPGEDKWPVPSMHGKSSAPDGHQHRVLLEVDHGDRELGLFATFDDVEVRTASGDPLSLE